MRERDQFRKHLVKVARQHMPKRKAADFEKELEALDHGHGREQPLRRPQPKRSKRGDLRQGRLL